MRTVPIPRNLVDQMQIMFFQLKCSIPQWSLKSFNDTKTIATSICDYVSSYPYEDNIQYEMYLNKDKNSGEFIANPVTELTRDAKLTVAQILELQTLQRSLLSQL